MGSALAITAFSLTVKLMGMLFRLYLTGRMGTEGMGLYQLIMSVYGTFTTLATAGLTVTVSGLASEKMITGGRGEAKLLLYRAIRLSLFISVPAGVIMLGGANVIAARFIGDIRTLTPLRILSLSMPFMAVAACLKGWFFAVTQPIKPSIASLLEQTVKIAVTVILLGTFMKGKSDPETLCIGTVAGITLGEMFSTALLGCMYLFKSGKDILPEENKREYDKNIRKVCFPIGAGACMTSLLHTCESVLIPKMLMLYGGEYESALSDFGIIRGMAIPLLFFPFSFLSSLISVTVPEISRLKALKNSDALKERTSKILTYGWVFSIATGGLFFLFPDIFGNAFYRTDEATRAIRILAAVTPMMYIETITDGMLKSIGEQTWTFFTGLINSVLRIAAVLFVIPNTGAEGYLWLLVVSNIFSYVMCAYRMKKKADSAPKIIQGITVPLLCFGAGGAAASMIKSAVNGIYPKAVCVTAVYLIIGATLYIIISKLWKAQST